MLKEFKVSVIMPAYNAEKYINESIESVINQTYKNWELIIVDDGCTDNTAAIINQFNSEPRIKYLYQQNGRQGKARNLGIKHSMGSYIAFLDADDKWMPNKLSLQTEVLAADSNIELLFSQGYSLTGNLVADLDTDVKKLWNSDNFSDFILRNRIPILSVLVKKEALEQVGGFSEKDNIQNVEDYHLWLKLLLRNKQFRSLPDRLFFYRIHPEQSTYQNKNLEAPIFHVYEDIFYSHPQGIARNILMNKLKWYIFNPAFHRECLDLIISHLNHQHKALIAFIIEKLFSKPLALSQRIVFKLVSTFGQK